MIQMILAVMVNVHCAGAVRSSLRRQGGSLDLGRQLADTCRMFDMEFFGGAFAERVREFSHDHDDAHLRFELVTLSGERLDALELKAVDTGASLATRDNRLVFLPYGQIAYVELAALVDRRVPGFQLSVGSNPPPAFRQPDSLAS
jgi:hypothetical protein